MDPIELSPEEIRQLLEGLFLWHHHGNVDRLESLGENLGYPVLLTTMSAMQFVASLCFDEGGTLDPLDEYFDRFMKRVDERYGIKFRLNMKRVGKQKDSDKLTLLDTNRDYTNTGTILREALRNRITHSCGSLLEVDLPPWTRSMLRYQYGRGEEGGVHVTEAVHTGTDNREATRG